MRISQRAIVFTGAIALDLGLGELPTRFHPVALFGRVMGTLDRTLEPLAARRPALAGSMLLGAGLGTACVAAFATHLVGRRLPWPLRIALHAAVLKQTFAVRSLFEHHRGVERPLAAGDLPGARTAVSRVVSRPAADLAETEVASAAIESLAENASDSAIAPWAWYAVAGLPGALTYRAVNTLDAMVGYRTRGEFGAPAARLDDVLNFVPARLAALAIASSSGQPLRTAAGALRDAGATPSPNSGWPMAAAAHALDVRLEKPGVHILNEGGAAPGPSNLRAAEQLVARALAVAAFFAARWLWRRR